MKKLTSEEFINKANKIHNNKFDYTKSNYVDSISKVEIICPIHGSFWQTPKNHLKGGCRFCSKEPNEKSFLTKAISIHKNKYSYGKYNGNNFKLDIFCPIHGKFQQMAYSHIAGHGCGKCDNKHQTTDDFIQKADIIHNNKFDYTKTTYINSTTKVVIICPIHGEFEQKPVYHLQKNGCPRCASSKGELEI